MEINSTVMVTFLTIINQVKVYHWQTLSHPRHKATDQLYSELNDLVDKFIEVLTGRLIIEKNNQNYRILLTDNLNHIKLNNYIDDNGYKLTEEFMEETVISDKKFSESVFWLFDLDKDNGI